MASTGIAVGLNKGFPTQKLESAPRPSSRRGVRAARRQPRVWPSFSTLTGRAAALQKLSQRTKLCRQVIREVTGFAPYEKRLLDILKVRRGA